MSKVKTAFFCSNCGYESVKWVGKCPSCDKWNTFIEEMIHKETQRRKWMERLYMKITEARKTIALNEIKSSEEKGL